MEQCKKNKQLSDLLLILWAGGAALLSYSLVYALRKPYTAASFEGLTFLGSDYKVAVTTIQILGYVIAKFFGIKIISELRKENRFRFFVGSAILAECALIAFGLIEAPYNVIAMFINGLSLGCMWGVIFSFIEGRKVTDILASLLGVSMVFSSGLAKSFGLFAMNEMNISQFWMPAVIGGFALPLLVFMGYMLKKLPHPTAEDIALRNERVIMDDDMIRLFKEKNAFLCTTLSPALPYALFDRSITNATEIEQFNGNVVFEGIIDCAKKAIANDIPVVLGNDVGCPWITQYDFWRELFYIHKYVGVSNAFALYTATARAAEMAGIGAETGTIEPGKSADLIVTVENPLEDLRALRKVEMVVTQGRKIDHPQVKINPVVAAELDQFLVE